jgi:hypothetical protein
MTKFLPPIVPTHSEPLAIPVFIISLLQSFKKKCSKYKYLPLVMFEASSVHFNVWPSTVQAGSPT